VNGVEKRSHSYRLRLLFNVKTPVVIRPLSTDGFVLGLAVKIVRLMLHVRM